MPELKSSVINIHQTMAKDDKEHSTTSLNIPGLVGKTWQDGSISLKNTEQSRPIELYFSGQKVHRCDCVECVSAVCSDSVHSAL